MVENLNFFNIDNNFRQVEFNLNIKNQDFELVIMSFVFEGLLYFSTIFKPKEYNHIIHRTFPTVSWADARTGLKIIFEEICLYHDVPQSNYPEILDFINKD